MNPLIQPTSNLPGYNIIIPIVKATNKFNRQVYTPVMTEEKISSEAVNKVLDDLELVTYQLQTDGGKFLTFLHRFVLPFFAFLFIYTSMYCGSYYYDYNYDRKSWTQFIIYCIIAYIYLKVSTKVQLMRVREKADSILQIHQAEFNKRGFRLFLPINFPEWIEIQRDSDPVQHVQIANPLSISQGVSRLMQTPAVQSVRQYGASVLQPLVTMVQAQVQAQNQNQGNQTLLNGQNYQSNV
jgi:hypothetical protein